MVRMPTADVSARMAWSDDAPAIAKVQLAAWRDRFADIFGADLLDRLDTTQVAEAWRQSMTQPADARQRLLVGLEHNTVCGFCVTGPSTDPGTDQVAVGEISDLLVSPEHYRQGHGSRLLQAAVDTLVADKFTLARAWVNSTDDAYRDFLTSAGWAADGAHRTLDLSGDGAAQVKQVRLHCSIG